MSPNFRNDSHNTPDRKAFNDAIRRLCQPGNQDQDVLALFVQIVFLLDYYNVSPKAWPEHEILQRSIVRGLNRLACGQPIPRPTAWITAECRKIIREIRYIQEREKPSDRLGNFADPVPKQNAEIAAEIVDEGLAGKAFEKLPLHYQQAIDLMVIRGLKSVEAQAALLAEGEQCACSTLRKRKERAIKQLKENYLTLKIES